VSDYLTLAVGGVGLSGGWVGGDGQLAEAYEEISQLTEKLERARNVVQEQRERIVRDENRFASENAKLRNALADVQGTRDDEAALVRVASRLSHPCSPSTQQSLPHSLILCVSV